MDPSHIAIIMDGNGRWAQQHGLSRINGHQQGAKTVEEIVKGSNNLGIDFLTLYTFSSENWKRSTKEVEALMNLLSQYLRNKSDTLTQHDIKLTTIGDVDGLPEEVRNNLIKVEEETSNNSSLTLVIAINYGSRREIVRAAKLIAEKVKSGKLNISDIDEKYFSNFLYTKNIPDPDLLIRTSGEFRLSNFLLWQISYTEIYITEKFWPDFKIEDLKKAIKNYKNRNRKFGGIKDSNVS